MTKRILTLAVATLSVSSSYGVHLTGLNGTPTDQNGNWHTGWYNTYGGNGDAGKNAFVIASNNPNGAFLNSGNSPTSTAIDVDLSAPGKHRFLAFFDGNEIYGGRDFWSLNLFFDGNNARPEISAFARPYDGSTQAPPQFWANSGHQLSVDGKAEVSGSGTLQFQRGNQTIRLTDFSTDTINVFGLDRVNNFALGASGRNDHVTQFSLEVVPEPSTVATLGLGAILGFRRRKKVG